MPVGGIEGDTIAAIATAAGVGGVGIVRLSGPSAIAIAAAALGVVPSALDRRVRLGWARDVAGQVVDQVLAFAMRAPASFTGEDVAELHGHGGPHNLARLLASVVERGARVASPGEFTRRAVAGGKLDLLRAEALLEVIHAGSDRAWRLAQANLGGQLGAHVEGLERRTLTLLAELEGAIDFPESDLELDSAAVVDAELGSLASACAALVDSFRHGEALSRGVTVALVGRVNVGKSSLLNALVGRERALVGAAPGTTRDWLEVSDIWSGVAVTLIDTAGLRATSDEVEQRGIALGAARVESADVVVVLDDGADWADATRFGPRAICVRSKADLAAPASSDIVTSAPRATALEDRRSLSGSAIGAARLEAGTSSTMAEGHKDSGAPSTALVGAPSTTMAQGHEASGPPSSVVIATSTTTGQGLDELRRRVLSIAGVADREGSEQPFVTTARQRAVAAVARDALLAAQASRRAGRAAELVVIEIREAAHALAQLRGVEVGERVLDEVFARFCIGK